MAVGAFLALILLILIIFLSIYFCLAQADKKKQDEENVVYEKSYLESPKVNDNDNQPRIQNGEFVFPVQQNDNADDFEGNPIIQDDEQEGP